MPKMDLLKLSNEEANRLTKKYLMNALVVLMKKNNYDDITITMLTKRAGISRTAFYNNYSSKDEVLEDLLKKLFNTIINYIGNPFENPSIDWYIAFFKGFKNNINRISLLLNAGFHGKFIEMINQRIVESKKVSSQYEKYRRIGWNGAFQMIVKRWFDEGMVESPEYMGSFCYNLLNRMENKNVQSNIF